MPDFSEDDYWKLENEGLDYWVMEYADEITDPELIDAIKNYKVAREKLTEVIDNLSEKYRDLGEELEL